jgi:hypothetical protein
VRNVRVKWLAIRGIPLQVIVVIQVADIANTIRIEIFLVRIAHGGAVVFGTVQVIPIRVNQAIGRTGSLVFTINQLTYLVATSRWTISRTQLSCLNVATDSVPASSTVHGTYGRALAAFTHTVAAGCVTILSAVVDGFALAAIAIAADIAIGRAIYDILTPVTDAVAAGRQAVHRAVGDVLELLAGFISAGRCAISSTAFEGLVGSAETVGTTTAVQ